MFPFVDAGIIKIPMYGVMIGVSYLISYYYLINRAVKYGFDKKQISDIIFYLVLWGFIGAKFLYIITFFNDFGNNFYERFINIFSISNIRAGFVFYGGVITSSLFFYLYSKKNNINFLQFGNFLVPAIPLAHSIGRLGCFFAGCCYGKPTDSLLGVRFTNPYCEVETSLIGHKLHPTQIYESAGNFLIFIFLNSISKNRNIKEGSLIFIYFILYSFLRFIIEFFRGDLRGSYFLSLSQAQVISIIVIAFSFVFLKKLWRIKK